MSIQISKKNVIICLAAIGLFAAGTLTGWNAKGAQVGEREQLSQSLHLELAKNRRQVALLGQILIAQSSTNEIGQRVTDSKTTRLQKMFLEQASCSRYFDSIDEVVKEKTLAEIVNCGSM